MLNEVKTSRYEPLYTLTEAEKIIDLKRSMRSRLKSNQRTYFFKQRACGVIMIILGCLMPVIDRESCVPAIVCIAIGLGLLITRQKVMTFWGWDDGNN